MFSQATRLLGVVLFVLSSASGLLSAQGTTFEVNLASIDQITLGLNADCSRTLLPNLILSGQFDADGDGQRAPDSLFTIVVMDGDPSNGPIIDGCGVFQWTATPVSGQADMISGFSFGNGQVTARDETRPTIFMSGAPTANLLYAGDLSRLTINNLAPSVSRSFRVMASTMMPDMTTIDPALLNVLIRGGSIPRFADNCSDISVTVSDAIAIGGPCDDITITRTFTAMDFDEECSDNPTGSGMTVDSYDIVLVRPNINQVIAPPNVSTFDCLDPAVTDLGPGENPAPRTEDYPTFPGTGGNDFPLNQNFQNIGVTFSDSDRIITCNNTYKVVRTFTVIDWCNTGNIRTFTQVVKVGDFDAPTIVLPTQDLNFDGMPDDGPLVFTTNAPNCGAFINTNFGGLDLTDGCSGATSLLAYILLNGDTTSVLGPIQPLSPSPINRISPFIPAGPHVLQYRAVDDCGNESIVEADILIEDRSGPVVIVEDALNVSLSNNGFATVSALELDEGSYDDCTDIILEIAFANPTNLSPIGVFGPSITLTCLDVGAIPVVIRATDANGNQNERMSILNVVDNTAPVCIAPASLALDCAMANTMLPEDVNAFFSADPIGTSLLFDTLFGAPTSIDNCGNEITSQNIVSNVNDCGTGLITRTFSVTDSRGFTSAPGCQQIINIQGIRDYSIGFPADAATTCGTNPDYDDIIVRENSCDMVLVNTQIDTFSTASDACFKLRITYEVINWCEYDGESDFYVIPRDLDQDGNLEEPTWLHILPGNSNGPQDDLARLDRDGNRDNGTYGPLGSDYANDGRRGAFRYFQFVKVFDDVAPTITNISSDVLGGAGCDGSGIQLDYSVVDNCQPDGIATTVELDLDYFGDVFVTSRVLDEELSNEGNGNFTILTDNLPAGQHAFRIRADDGCGNRTQRIVEFEVENGAVPAPSCIETLTFVLMNDGAGGGLANIEADDFVAFVNGNCGDADLAFSVYREEEEAQQPGFDPVPGRPNFLVDCGDVGEIPLRVYAFDPEGRGTFCAVVAEVQPFDGNVCDDGGLGSLAGFITTVDDDLLPGIEVNITDNVIMADRIMTDNNGSFLFTGLQNGGTYMVQPDGPDQVDLTRIKTSDIIALTRHILGTREITDPYRLVAADVSADGYVDVIDIVGIRRVILGIDPGYLNSPAWRFIRADYEFPASMTEGWDVRDFPSYYSVDELQGDNREADFVALEMGDVFSDGRGRGTESLAAEDVRLFAGQTHTIDFRADDLNGLQGTFEALEGLDLLSWSSQLLGDGNVNDRQLDRGLLGFSFNQAAALNGAVVMSLTVSARHDMLLSDYLRLGDHVAVSEGYSPAGSASSLILSFKEATGGTDNMLYQNFPNPATSTTTIAFDLRQAGLVVLQVHDVNGRLLLNRQLEGLAGRNQLELSTTDFMKNTTGILTYTLVVGQERMSKRMTVLNAR